MKLSASSYHALATWESLQRETGISHGSERMNMMLYSNRETMKTDDMKNKE